MCMMHINNDNCNIYRWFCYYGFYYFPTGVVDEDSLHCDLNCSTISMLTIVQAYIMCLLLTYTQWILHIVRVIYRLLGLNWFLAITIFSSSRNKNHNNAGFHWTELLFMNRIRPRSLYHFYSLLLILIM